MTIPRITIKNHFLFKEVVAHWRENLEKARRQKQPDISTKSCAFCTIYLTESITASCQKCGECPIKASTGYDGCKDTPYESILHLFYDLRFSVPNEWERLVSFVEDELSFILTLRKKMSEGLWLSPALDMASFAISEPKEDLTFIIYPTRKIFGPFPSKNDVKTARGEERILLAAELILGEDVPREMISLIPKNLASITRLHSFLQAIGASVPKAPTNRSFNRPPGGAFNAQKNPE